MSTSLATERFIFLGYVFGAMCYQANVALAYVCIRALYSRLRTLGSDPSRRRPIALSFASALIFFTLSTILVYAQLADATKQYVDNQDAAPEGLAQISSILNQLQNVCTVMMLTLADGLLLWRIFIIYNRSLRVLAFPMLSFLAVTALAVVYLYVLAHPPKHNSVQRVPFFAVNQAYSIMLVADNVLLTSLIIGRLIWFGRRTREALGSAGNKYMTIATIIGESALPYTAGSLAVAICYGVNPAACQGVDPLLGQLAALSPLLILWRIASGTALSGRETMDQVQSARAVPLSTLRFKANAGSRVSTDRDGDAARSIEVRAAAKESGHSDDPLRCV